MAYLCHRFFFTEKKWSWPIFAIGFFFFFTEKKKKWSWPIFVIGFFFVLKKKMATAYLCYRFFFFLLKKKKMAMAYLCHKFFFVPKKKMAMAHRRHRPEFLWNVQFQTRMPLGYAIQDGDCPHSKQRLPRGRGVKRGFNSSCEGKPSSK